MRKLGKKGQVVANLQTFIMAVVTIAVILAVGLFVLEEVQTATETTNSSGGVVPTDASTATGSIIEKLGQAPVWIGILIVVVFASAILAYFYMR